ncbi:hypothetical protein SUGI_0013480 [Cryptomeria japonica]|uniref:uncharacterized protein LOC131040630 n=1 Tax=Cryptomeria japonica TaxID=3369 RepID=UPI002408D920|nr:uncharacterized protein LOC131040630 [Cryptomeria japonica]GLJ05199.1 hypothetical protein SUGI_0013480 [Cryptomeria japonica]
MERDFQGIVGHCLANSFYNRAAFSFNSAQCSNLCYAFIAKLSPYFLSKWQISRPGNDFCFKNDAWVMSMPEMGCRGSKIMQQAWEEVCRVVKEAEAYLDLCSDENWGINSLILPSTGEAYAVHLHDLVWSLVCLDLNVLFLELEKESELLQLCGDGGSCYDSDMIDPACRATMHKYPNAYMFPGSRNFLYSKSDRHFRQIWQKRYPSILDTKPKNIDDSYTQCLDVQSALLRYTDERYSEAACTKMGDFCAEMSNLNRVHDEYQDKRGLIFSFEQFLNAHQQLAQGSCLKMNVEEERKATISKFIAAKLQASIRNEPAIKGRCVSPWLQIDIKDLIISHKSIGEGSSGLVREGSWLGLKVAVKELQIDNYTMDEVTLAEIDVHAKLYNPFVVQLIGVCVTERFCYLVMELLSSSLDTILKERLERNKPSLPLPVAVDIMLQISRAMEYLHSHKIMHMDLKAANVLIQPSAVPEFRYQGYGRVKLCDFGHSSLRLHSFRCSDWPKGTSHWRAPEVFVDPQEDLEIEAEPLKEYTYKADVYSFGMTCYEILTGKQPFEDVQLAKHVFRKIAQGERPSLPSSCPLVLADYIKKCWDTDPRHRPCFSQVSNFLRYIKLLIMRTTDSRDWDSLSALCKGFDKHELVKCSGEGGGLDERPAYLEEERIIVRALDGDFPGFFFPHPLSHQMARPSSPRVEVFGNLPDYIQQYSYEEIMWATDCFTRNISEASRVMLRGILQDGTPVTVKEQVKLEISMGEINILCRLHHPNIVRLRGVSAISWPSSPQQCKTFLVYDQMVMGSLSALLFRPKSILNWNLRKKIGLGIAQFIAYIHDNYGKRRKRLLDLHISSNNIYLDERFTPKYCGFESAIYINNSNSQVKQLELALQLEEFRNVKDFGIILLELLSGCKWEDMQYSLSSIHNSIKTEGSKFLSHLLDRELQGKVNKREAMRWVKLALWCFSRYPAVQPTMNQAVLVMKGLKEFSALPPSVIGSS